MANFVPPDSGSDWTQNGLASYHITINQELPPPLVAQEPLAIADAEDLQQGRSAQLINLLDLPMIPGSEETSVDEFSVELFKVLGYVRRNRVARTRMDISFLNCGKGRHAKFGVCILDRSQNDILFLVREDKKGFLSDTVGVRAQLVADAVGAFNTNNVSRETVGLVTLAEKVMPGIVMVDTSPSFFKIPATQTLSIHIALDTYPPEETHVTFCYPPLSHHRWRSDGMKPLVNRREILRCSEAFKVIVGI